MKTLDAKRSKCSIQCKDLYNLILTEADMISLVLTVIGPDRPGLVEKLANTINDHSGNWMESALSRLAGKFTGIVSVTAPADKKDELLKALAELEADGLKIVSEVAEDEASHPAGQLFTLDLIGHDKPGIVREISQALASHHVNVESLSTELVSGSMSAELLFKANAQLNAPEDLDLDHLQEALENIASDLLVDISFNQ